MPCWQNWIKTVLRYDLAPDNSSSYFPRMLIVRKEIVQKSSRSKRLLENYALPNKKCSSFRKRGLKLGHAQISPFSDLFYIKSCIMYYYNFYFTQNKYAKITCSNAISYILFKMYFSTISATPSSSLLSVISSAISRTCFWELAMAMPFPAY